MKMKTLCGAVAAVFLTVGWSAQGGLLLDFQDLGGGSDTIPTGYWGFTWGGGWSYATENGNTYVYAANPNAATIQRANGGLFSFEGADFAGIGTVTVEGRKGGALIGTLQTGQLSQSFSSFRTLIENVDTLVISGTNWRMDNFADSVMIPEPATLIAGALLVLPFAASTIRILRRRHVA